MLFGLERRARYRYARGMSAGLLVILLLAAACTNAPEPLPLPTVTTAPASQALETEQPEPTLTRQAPASPEPTPTAEPTFTPMPTTTSTPTPTVEPTPVVSVSELVHQAERLSRDGAFAQAIPLWEELLDTSDIALREYIIPHLARAAIEEGRHDEAVEHLLNALGDDLSPELRAECVGLIAIAYEGQGEWQLAIDRYREYLSLESAAEALVRLRIASAYQALGQNELEIQELAGIPWAQLSTSHRAEGLEQLAAAHRRMGDYESALATYDQILSFASTAYRALVTQWQGETLREAESTEEAIAVFQSVLRDSPETGAAYQALLALDDLGVSEVDDLQRGEIAYHAGQSAAAIEALQRYLDTGGDQPARAYFFLGRAFQYMREHEQAMAQFTVLIEQHPQSTWYPEAWMQRARSLTILGGEAAQLYAEFAERHPEHPRAPEALWLGAAAAERAHEWALAFALYGRLEASYPAYEHIEEAFFRRGLMAYALGDWEGARTIFAQAVQGSLAATEQARRLTWLGKAMQAQGNVEAAHGHWTQAHAAAPANYYGLRARDLLAGRIIYLPENLSQIHQDAGFDAETWEAIIGWTRSWAGAGEIPDLGGRPLARRGDTLLRLGWYGDAVAAYRLLYDQVADDPLALVALARHGLEQELYPIVIQAADRLRSLGRTAGAEAPPTALERLSYPAGYDALIDHESEQRNLDPLLFMALVRQESRFHPRAVSWAGATGLTQVMPATGAWIAEQLGETAGYRHELLYRPAVGVRFGVYYLANLLDMYDRDWIAALVGYNAGPGGLNRMSGGHPISDHDLFYETMYIAESKAYVRIIYQNYAVYEDLYR